LFQQESGSFDNFQLGYASAVAIALLECLFMESVGPYYLLQFKNYLFCRLLLFYIAETDWAGNRATIVSMMRCSRPKVSFRCAADGGRE
jgi:hypothetical protein